VFNSLKKMLLCKPDVCQIRAPGSQARVTRRILWALLSFYARKWTNFINLGDLVHHSKDLEKRFNLRCLNFLNCDRTLKVNANITLQVHRTLVYKSLKLNTI